MAIDSRAKNCFLWPTLTRALFLVGLFVLLSSLIFLITAIVYALPREFQETECRIGELSELTGKTRCTEVCGCPAVTLLHIISN